MYTAENYYWGLVGYYFGCTLLMLFCYRFRQVMPGRHVRNVLLLLIFVLLLVPIDPYTNTNYLAPAWFVSIFETLTLDIEQPYFRGLRPIIICYLTALACYIFWAFIRRSRISTKTRKSLKTPTSSNNRTEPS